jgi:hypothetical protein
MSSLNAEQEQILQLVDTYCDNLDVTWNKFKGDVVCRIIQQFIGRHLSATNNKIVGPNAYIDGFPYEFDLLVIDKSAEPRELTSSYQAQNVRCVIEVKKGGVYSPAQPKKIAGIFNAVVSRYSHMKCGYLTVEEVYTVARSTSMNFYNISKRELGRHGFFALRDLRGKKQIIPGEWVKFINFILHDC